jgi:hypothetical protein
MRLRYVMVVDEPRLYFGLVHKYGNEMVPEEEAIFRDRVRIELLSACGGGDKAACNALQDWYEDHGIPRLEER